MHVLLFVVGGWAGGITDNTESGAVHGVVLLGGWRAVARTLRGIGNDIFAVHGFVCRVACEAV